MTGRHPVLYERHGPVAIITINRPRHANALNRAVRERLFDVWQRFENQADARIAILTGAGSEAFCAGADLVEMSDAGLAEPPTDWVPVLGRNVTVTKPVIAAVNGLALGAGFLQMHMCDLVIAADTARVGIPEARWGRGAPWALPIFGSVAPRVLMELLLTAQPLTAARAHQVGLINRLVDSGEVLSAALSLATTIAENAPLSLRAAKQMASVAASISDPVHAEELTRRLWSVVYDSNDAQIGPQAFKKGEQPVWTET